MPSAEVVPINRAKPPIRIDADDFKSLSREHEDYLALRGIGIHVVNKCFIHTATKYFREVGELDCIAFPYFSTSGEVLACKYRTLEKEFTSEGHFNTCYLSWLLPKDPENHVLFIVEGEIDALVMKSLGREAVVSVPNGANVGAHSEWLVELVALAANFAGVAIAVDNDEPGRKCAERLSHQLPNAVVAAFEGEKDIAAYLDSNGPISAKLAIEKISNEVLAKSERVRKSVGQLVANANLFLDRLQQLYRGEISRGFDIGLGAGVHKLYSVPLGALTVITGWPNDGKSQFLDNILVALARDHGLKAAIWSPENNPEVHIARLMEIKSGTAFFSSLTGATRMTPEAMIEELRWVDENFLFLPQSYTQEASLDSILARMSEAIANNGAKICVIDPYNYIDKPQGVDNDVEWIRRLLIKLKRFVQTHDVHCFLVAHPRQLPAGSRRFPPTGFHISGGGQWNAITDFGITMYRPKVETDGYGPPPCESELVVWKVRHKWHGQRGVASLDYNPRTGRYSAPLASHQEHVRHWQDDNDDV